MWAILIRLIIGLLLIIHGFAHWNMTTVWGSKVSAQLWLLGESVALGTVLWALALIEVYPERGCGVYWFGAVEASRCGCGIDLLC